MEPIYHEQYKRVKRFYERFVAINNGRIHSTDSANYQDEIYAFFMTCYHLKDWIINDPLNHINTNVEKFVHSNKALMIAGDISNGFKHLKLTTPKVGSGAKVSGSIISLVIGPEEPVIKINYSIIAGAKQYDAFTVATDCMKLWESFLKDNDPMYQNLH